MINLEFYSPVEELFQTLFTEKRVRVFIKRDDMIHPFLSGNKWRKLKYILRTADQQGKDHLVTFGGAWSNHLLATACAGAKFGFKTTGIVRGEQVSNPVLKLCSLFGMDLKFTDRESYRDKYNLFKTYAQGNEQCFFIDEGGAGPEAAKGCSELVAELDREYDHIFCACGTGTTSAGIINGLIQAASQSCFHAVPVLKNAGFICEAIEKHLLSPHPFEFHTDFHFGGYAKVKPGLMEFIKDFASSTGILLDPVYTGKLVFAVYSLLKDNYFEQNATVLIIHTGGLAGLYGYDF